MHYALYKVKVASKDPAQKTHRSMGLKREHLRLLAVGVCLHVCALCKCGRARGRARAMPWLQATRSGASARFAARAMPLHVLSTVHAPAQTLKEL